MQEKNKFGLGVIVGVVLGLAGAYALSNKNRIKAKWWIMKARREIFTKLDEMKDLTKDTYVTTIETVVERFKKLKDVNVEEFEEFTEDMKGKFAEIKKRYEERKEEKAM